MNPTTELFNLSCHDLGGLPHTHGEWAAVIFVMLMAVLLYRVLGR